MAECQHNLWFILPFSAFTYIIYVMREKLEKTPSGMKEVGMKGYCRTVLIFSYQHCIKISWNNSRGDGMVWPQLILWTFELRQLYEITFFSYSEYGKSFSN